LTRDLVLCVTANKSLVLTRAGSILPLPISIFTDISDSKISAISISILAKAISTQL